MEETVALPVWPLDRGLAAAVALGGQVAGVVGTVWEPAAGIDAGKAAGLRRLGFDPTAGVLINPGLLGGRLAALRMAGSALAVHPPGPDP
jgi:hypothetical protein